MAKLLIVMGLDTWLPETKDQLIAPQISKFDQPQMPDITCHRKYLLNPLINNIHFHGFENFKRQLFFNVVRRAEAAFEEYCSARESAHRYIENKDRSVTDYFSSVRHFEHCLSELNQLNGLANEIRGTNGFAPGDGSVAERVSILSAWCRHFEDKYRKNAHAQTDSFTLFSRQRKVKDLSGDPHFSDTSNVPIWLANDSLCCKVASISYVELSDYTMHYYKAAEDIATFKPK